MNYFVNYNTTVKPIEPKKINSTYDTSSVGFFNEAWNYWIEIWCIKYQFIWYGFMKIKPAVFLLQSDPRAFKGTY